MEKRWIVSLDIGCIKNGHFIKHYIIGKVHQICSRADRSPVVLHTAKQW